MMTTVRPGAVNLFDGNRNPLIGTVFKTQEMQAFNRMAGGLASELVNFGAGGDITLNVLNLDILGLKAGGQKVLFDSGLSSKAIDEILRRWQ